MKVLISVLAVFLTFTVGCKSSSGSNGTKKAAKTTPKKKALPAKVAAKSLESKKASTMEIITMDDSMIFVTVGFRDVKVELPNGFNGLENTVAVIANSIFRINVNTEGYITYLSKSLPLILLSQLREAFLADQEALDLSDETLKEIVEKTRIEIFYLDNIALYLNTESLFDESKNFCQYYFDNSNGIELPKNISENCNDITW